MTAVGAPLVVPVTGPPGAGKSSTLLELTRRRPDLVRFGVRDHGLWLAERGHPFGLAVREPLRRQELLTDERVRDLFLQFLRGVPAGTSVVAVEGYPRDVAQCEDLLHAVRAEGSRVHRFVLIDVPDEVVRRRVADRRLCLHCGHPTDDLTIGACAACGGAVGRRRDDEPVRFERRLAEYREVCRGPVEYFAERGLLHVVDGSLPVDDVRAALHDLLDVTAGGSARPLRGERAL